MSQMLNSNRLMNTIHDGFREEVGPEQLTRVDLNLLVAFDALVRELSVTRAAERVGVTQSAMSHSLRRLRELFDDPLLVRGSGGMLLTPRAHALSIPMRSGLTLLGRALASPDGFDPRTARRVFCIASPDLFDVLVVPPLLARIRRQAPGVDLRIMSLQERRVDEQLETGEVDMAILPRTEPSSAGAADQRERTANLQGGLLQRTLFRDHLVCLLRRDHPCLRRPEKGTKKVGRLTIESYAALSHLLVSPRGAGLGPVDTELARHGLSRRIALRIPHFYSALAIVAASDLVCTAPSALAAHARSNFPVTGVPAPLPLPVHSVNAVWHERFTKDPGHTWLRALMAEVARSVEKTFSPGARGRSARAVNAKL
jgi:DNA-binding transcriptional LysR family regulator